MKFFKVVLVPTRMDWMLIKGDERQIQSSEMRFLRMVENIVLDCKISVNIRANFKNRTYKKYSETKVDSPVSDVRQ